MPKYSEEQYKEQLAALEAMEGEPGYYALYNRLYSYAARHGYTKPHKIVKPFAVPMPDGTTKRTNIDPDAAHQENPYRDRKDWPQLRDKAYGDDVPMEHIEAGRARSWRAFVATNPKQYDRWLPRYTVNDPTPADPYTPREESPRLGPLSPFEVLMVFDNDTPEAIEERRAPYFPDCDPAQLPWHAATARQRPGYAHPEGWLIYP